MKVLIFTTQFYQTGGAERLAVELAIELNRLGVKTDVLSLYSKRTPDEFDARSRLLEAGVPRILCLGLSVGPSFFSVLHSLYRFRKLVKNEGYSTVEISGFTPSLIALLASVGIKSNLVFGIHQNYFKEVQKGARYFIWRRLMRFSRNMSFYAISKSVKKDWLDYVKIPKNRVKVVYNSINIDYFNQQKIGASRSKFRESLGCSESARVILYIGRLVKSKGIDTLFEGLKDQLSSRDLHLVFVGRFDDSESSDDSKLLADMQGEKEVGTCVDRLHFLGFRSDIPEIMSASDLLVHPPRREGFGLVLAEALAVGLPIVASNVGGIPEVLANTDAIMVPPDHPEALAKAVFTVLGWSKDKQSSAIAKGKKRAELFRPDKRAKLLLPLLEK